MGQVTPKISTATASRSGFTLIEIVIVITVIAAVISLGVSRIGQNTSKLRSTVRKLGVITRDLHSRARLQNATYRLVINMGSESDREPHHEYWVEKAQGAVINNYDPKNPPKPPELAKADGTDSDSDKAETTTSSPADFAPDPTFFKRPESFDDGLLVESVELGTLDQPITSGIAYIHFLPSGYADESAIHLKVGDKLHWTIAINPLTGRSDIIGENRPLEDLRAK